MLKQKAKLLSIFAGVLVFVSISVFANTNTAHAIYTVSAGQACQDGSAAAPTPVRGVTQYRCDDSTKKTTTGTGTATPAAGDATATGTATGQTADATDGVTCAVEKIGWIICPIMEGAAKISDKAFDVLGDNFLRTDPELFDDKSGTKYAWDIARNLGNIMFIIAFLIIIASQVSGQGLSNYGIKRMLPRLVIAAIAVNVSYYICQLAVDLTNILGYEIQNALGQIANSVGPSVFGQSADSVSAADGGSGVLTDGTLLTTIVVGALATAAVVFFLLPTMAAMIPLILITVVTIIIILLLRKALIVLLIVISPIAFVMYLLPNTEKYFSKWMNMFTQLLMVFPVVGMLFGAGQLASTIILAAGTDGNQSTAAAACDPNNAEQKAAYDKTKTAGNNSVCGEKSVTIQGGKDGNNTCFAGQECKADKPITANWTLGLVAMGIAVAPLLAVWAVLKGALSATGAIGKTLTSAVSKGVNGAGKPLNSAGGALSKRLKEDRDGIWQRSQARGLTHDEGNRLDNIAGGFAKRRGNRAMRQNLTKHALDTATNHAVGNTENIEGLLGGLTGSERSRAISSVLAQEDQHAIEEVKNAQTRLRRESGGDMDVIAKALEDAIANGDKTGARAAQNELMGMGGAGVDRFAQAIIAAEKAGQGKGPNGTIADLKINTATSHGGIKEKSGDLNSWMSNSKEGVEGQLATQSANGGSFSGLSDAQIAGQTHAALHAAIKSGGLKQADAQRVLGNANASAALGGTQRKMLQALLSGATNGAVAATYAPKETKRI